METLVYVVLPHDHCAHNSDICLLRVCVVALLTHSRIIQKTFFLFSQFLRELTVVAYFCTLLFDNYLLSMSTLMLRSEDE